MAKLFYVEDDPNLSLVVKETLESAGHEVYHYSDGQEAIKAFKGLEPDLCLLDIMLPGTDGYTIAQTIRLTDKNIPIIFLSAKAQLEDKLHGLQIGGDDYIFKPFSVEELLLKIKIFFKRKDAVSTDKDRTASNIEFGKFTFDPRNQTLTSNGEVKNMTLRETELLKFFLHNKNQLVKREEILLALWGQDDYFLGRSLDVFISRLRKYLASDESVQIETIPRVGFRMNLEEE